MVAVKFVKDDVKVGNSLFVAGDIAGFEQEVADGLVAGGDAVLVETGTGITVDADGQGVTVATEPA